MMTTSISFRALMAAGMMAAGMVAGGLALATPAAAQTVMDENTPASELIEALKGGGGADGPCAEGEQFHNGQCIKTRAIRLGGGDNAAEAASSGSTTSATTAAATTSAPAAPAPSSSGRAQLKVLFEFNSATLTPQARQVLDTLAAALNSADLAGSRFEVLGHTDAKGSEAYNLDLSRQRAQAVRDYLAIAHAISASRLMAKGMGETQPLPGTDPNAGVNRRVEIVNIGN